MNHWLSAYDLRAYCEADRAAASGLGAPVIDWWHEKGPEASLHWVVVRQDTAEIVGHLQVMDAGVPEPSRRQGQCHFCLDVALEHRRRGIGGALYALAEEFARRRAARMLYTAYLEHEDAPASGFLKKRGFEPLEWFYPSSLDLRSFNPTPFEPAIRRVESQGIRLLTYAECGDSDVNRRKLHALEQIARAAQPYREVNPHIPEPFESWERDFARRDPTLIFVAVLTQEEAWVGVVTGLEWYFTGVHPNWRGRGVATALKLLCIMEAKRSGILKMETENHCDNLAMIAVNRKLGFIFTTPEIACIKRL